MKKKQMSRHFFFFIIILTHGVYIVKTFYQYTTEYKLGIFTCIIYITFFFIATVTIKDKSML